MKLAEFLEAPSSDGYAKPAPKSRRKRSGKRPGKQPGDPGRHLAQRCDPDATKVGHPPSTCEKCGDDLADAHVTGRVVRQVFDLPPLSLLRTEHQAERRRCRCDAETTGAFPSQATASSCYVVAGSSGTSTDSATRTTSDSSPRSEPTTTRPSPPNRASTAYKPYGNSSTIGRGCPLHPEPEPDPKRSGPGLILSIRRRSTEAFRMQPPEQLRNRNRGHRRRCFASSAASTRRRKPFAVAPSTSSWSSA